MTVTLEDRFKEYAKLSAADEYTNMDDICLDGSEIKAMGSLEFLKKCTKLESLTMNHCGIKKIETFPAGLAIERLELMDNEISGGLAALGHLSKLVEVSLTGNQIASAKDLAPLAGLTNLKVIDVSGNPFTSTETYRKEVFEILPHIEVVDMQDKEGNVIEIESDEDEYDSTDMDSDGYASGGHDSEDSISDSDDEDDDSEDFSSDDDEDDDDEEDDDEEDEEPVATKKARKE